MQNSEKLDKYVGFTQKQKDWIKKRDSHRCLFRQKIDGGWVQCSESEDLHIHHIIPKTWALHNIPYGFKVNGPLNAVTLCSFHHVGYNAPIDQLPYIVHPDVEKVRLAYTNGDAEAYNRMRDIRRELIDAGVPYWNPEYDWYFSLVARELTKTISEEYPRHRKYGLLGA